MAAPVAPAEDWDVMFGAVVGRLKSALSAPQADLRNGAGYAMQAEALACVDALELLRAGLRRMRAGRATAPDADPMTHAPDA
ncbi:MAG: hypothetical protein ACKVQR_23235 [Aquabacterium sp.]